MSANPGSETSHPWRENIETASIAIVMALILKYFTLEAFQIPTGSMQPTLMGLDARVTNLSNGEATVTSTKIFDRILVDKLVPFFRDPNRWEIWVFLYPLDKSNRYIKRVVGLPGEELKVEYGDIKTRKSSKEEWRTERKPLNVQESMWLRVWENEEAGPADQFWDLTGFDINKNTLVANGKAEISAKRQIYDAYDDGYPTKVKPLLAATSHEPCNDKVRDMRIKLDVSPSAEHRILSMKLGWGGDALRAEISGPAGDGKVKLIFNEREIGAKDGRLKFNHTSRVEFSRADEAAWISIDGEILARAEFESVNSPGENRVVIQSDGGSLTIPSLALDRDVYYTNMNGFRTTTVPPGHYFMMGDNSTFSSDGRAWQERTIELKNPVEGLLKLTGGTRTSGANSDRNPHTFSAPGLPRSEIFRDEWGEEYRISDSLHIADAARSFVPRDHFLGRAFFVFWPWPPLAPVFRVGFVR
ncbi:MAG: signal peptidase I [Planctomycetes bacterium]|nr:signal peptidase I [Planctomycetota bacterium]